MPKPAIDLMPRSPRGCCFAGPWAVGNVCRLPSWPRNTASSTVSAPAAPCFQNLPPSPFPHCPPKPSHLVGVVRRSSVLLLLLALCHQQFSGPSSQGWFFPENMAIKTLTNKNTSTAQRAHAFSSHHISLLGSSGFSVLCTRGASSGPCGLPGSHSSHIIWSSAADLFSPVPFGSPAQASGFMGKQFLNQRKASRKLVQFQ